MSKFSDLLNECLLKSKFSAASFSKTCDISPSALSRYKSDTRTPDEETVKKIGQTFSEILDDDTILTDFLATIHKENISFHLIAKKLDTLIDTLGINVSDMSNHIGYDASYISRIRRNERKPAKSEAFVNSICQYVSEQYNTQNKLFQLSALLDCDPSSLTNSNVIHLLISWFNENTDKTSIKINSFLERINSFNTDDFNLSIKYDELKIPNLPFYRTPNRYYYGTEDMKLSELEFFKSSVLSKSSADIFMRSTMILSKEPEDADYQKKWQYGLSLLLKRGFHINIIHDFGGSFDEIIEETLSWIPIYMTGQVTPYYMSLPDTSPYQNILYVSGSTVLFGDWIRDFHSEGRNMISSKKEDIKHYRLQAKRLLSKAHPLFEIYDKNQASKFSKKYGPDMTQITPDPHLKNKFSNISIRRADSDYVIVSMDETPNIHLVVRHPRIVDAIANCAVLN